MQECRRTIRAADLPVVDLSAHESNILRDVGRACVDWGAMYVTNHGIPETTIRRAFDETDAFFSLSEDKKMRSFEGPTAIRGYQPFGHQKTNSETQKLHGDQKEGFLIGIDHEPAPGGERQPLHAPNVWPGEEAPSFQSAMEAFMDPAVELCRRLVSCMEQCLGAEATSILNHMEPGMPILRPLRYSLGASQPDQGLFGIGAHTDYGAITLVATRGPGLEIKQHGTEEWQNIEEREGALVVYLGDTFERWTNGRWRAALHRVAIPGECAVKRLSLTLFLKPNSCASLATLPCCIDPDNPQKWPETTFEQHLFSALKPTYQTAPGAS